MNQWEYCYKHQPPTIGDTEFVALLTDMGRFGWELVSIIPEFIPNERNQNVTPSAKTFYFKRQVGL